MVMKFGLARGGNDKKIEGDTKERNTERL